MVKCVTRGRYLVGLCLELRSIGGLCPTISVCAWSSAPSVAYAPPARSVLGAPLRRWLMSHQLGLCLELRETSLDCAVRVVSPMGAGAFGPSCHLTLFITVLLCHQLIQEQDLPTRPEESKEKYTHTSHLHYSVVLAELGYSIPCLPDGCDSSAQLFLSTETHTHGNNRGLLTYRRQCFLSFKKSSRLRDFKVARVSQHVATTKLEKLDVFAQSRAGELLYPWTLGIDFLAVIQFSGHV